MNQQNKLLAHEKWQIGQEAAQLIGQINIRRRNNLHDRYQFC
jgi:hypothetical protein